MKELLFKLKWCIARPRALAAYKMLSERPASPERTLRRIVRHAMEHTEFYMKFYRSVGFRVEDIGSDGWFERLPVVTKSDLRCHFEDMTGESQRRYIVGDCRLVGASIPGTTMPMSGVIHERVLRRSS